MSDLQIITNRQPRQLLNWFDLTPAEQADFDYITDESGSFFRYRGACYDLDGFLSRRAYHENCNRSPFGSYWQGYSSDTYFSGVLVHLCRDTDYVIVGRYYS